MLGELLLSASSCSLIADMLAERIDRDPNARRYDVPTADGYLAPEAAAAYLGVTRKRVHDLTSMRAIEPDGRDGRTPLFKRSTLDHYVLTHK